MLLARESSFRVVWTLLIILVIEAIYEESEEKKKYENRKANKGRNKKA